MLFIQINLGILSYLPFNLNSFLAHESMECNPKNISRYAMGRNNFPAKSCFKGSKILIPSSYNEKPPFYKHSPPSITFSKSFLIPIFIRKKSCPDLLVLFLL
ncbi:hypothetical protein V6Z12_A13G120900 [Gossypium hirsutum]